MSRVLSVKEAAQRGATRRDGSLVEDKAVVAVESPAVAPAAPVIDTSPIADEISRLSGLIKSALDSQSEALGKIAEKPELHDFEFTVSDRDHQGRIVKVVARRIIKQSPKGVTR